MDFNVSKCKLFQMSTHYTKSFFSYQMSDFSLEIVK